MWFRVTFQYTRRVGGPPSGRSHPRQGRASRRVQTGAQGFARAADEEGPLPAAAVQVPDAGEPRFNDLQGIAVPARIKRKGCREPPHPGALDLRGAAEKTHVSQIV